MAETPVTRTRPWVRILLLMSLALNLAVAGLAFGLWTRFGGDRMPPGTSGAVFFREMPPDLRREMRAQTRAALRGAGFDRRQSMAQIMAAIRADPFDAAELARLMQVQSAALQDGQKRFQSVWLEQVQQMSPDQRAAYADRVQQALDKRRSGPRRD